MMPEDLKKSPPIFLNGQHVVVPTDVFGDAVKELIPRAAGKRYSVIPKNELMDLRKMLCGA